MSPSLLDTDILSEVLKQKNPIVVSKAPAYLQAFQHFTISAVTRYEIIRGLKWKSAIRQSAQFATFCQHSVILPLTDAIFDRAADLWVTAHQSGRPQKDARAHKRMVNGREDNIWHYYQLLIKQSADAPKPGSAEPSKKPWWRFW